VKNKAKYPYIDQMAVITDTHSAPPAALSVTRAGPYSPPAGDPRPASTAKTSPRGRVRSPQTRRGPLKSRIARSDSSGETLLNPTATMSSGEMNTSRHPQRIACMIRRATVCGVAQRTTGGM